jgi:hypothetical protein
MQTSPFFWIWLIVAMSSIFFSFLHFFLGLRVITFCWTPVAFTISFVSFWVLLIYMGFNTIHEGMLGVLEQTMWCLPFFLALSIIIDYGEKVKKMLPA